MSALSNAIIAAEMPDERQRQRLQLGPVEVGGHRLVDLIPFDRVAAQAHPRTRNQRRDVAEQLGRRAYRGVGKRDHERDAAAVDGRDLVDGRHARHGPDPGADLVRGGRPLDLGDQVNVRVLPAQQGVRVPGFGVAELVAVAHALEDGPGGQPAGDDGGEPEGEHRPTVPEAELAPARNHGAEPGAAAGRSQ
ncbi:hypothetical protein [Rhizomonospora bruguierae]|uniref:hypothetical protein n=1 Tax=Rhizomonospora bruguierae TaxID=1581705 RepID=UPI001BD11C02|nr:hypothetical protein [Micromonospora sp. NBRC 107566]